MVVSIKTSTNPKKTSRILEKWSRGFPLDVMHLDEMMIDDLMENRTCVEAWDPAFLPAHVLQLLLVESKSFLHRPSGEALRPARSSKPRDTTDMVFIHPTRKTLDWGPSKLAICN